MSWLERELQFARESATVYREIARDARRRGRDDTAELFATYAATAEQRLAELEWQATTSEATA